MEEVLLFGRIFAHSFMSLTLLWPCDGDKRNPVHKHIPVLLAMEPTIHDRLCIQACFTCPFHLTMMFLFHRWTVKPATMCLRKHTTTSVFVTTIPSHAHVYIWQKHKAWASLGLDSGLRPTFHTHMKFQPKALKVFPFKGQKVPCHTFDQYVNQSILKQHKSWRLIDFCF